MVFCSIQADPGEANHTLHRLLNKVSPLRDVTLLARRAVLPWSYN